MLTHNPFEVLASRRIAVFSALDIETFSGTDEQLKYHDGELKIYTTMKLEKALEEGYTVYVVTVLERRLQDEWWINLVGADHVFFVSPGTSDSGRWSTDPAYRRPWRELFEKLDLPWNYYWDDWRQARQQLKRHAIRMGSDF